MQLIAFFLFVMIILTLFNGLIFFKKLIKLQEENNDLIKKLLKKDENDDKSKAMASEDLEKLKNEYLHKMKK